MPTPKESARKARTLANETNLTKYGSRDLVRADAKLNKKTLTPAQEKKAVDAMQTRRMNDRNKSALRAEFIARREDPRKKPSAGLKRAQAKDAANALAIKKAADAAAAKAKKKK